MAMRALFLTAAFLVGVTASSEAGTFQISPTRLDLAARGSSALVTLTNTGVEPVRLQAKVFSWDQAPDGEQRLTSASELVVFPTLFTLAPGETRKVKVGITAAPQARERTFRLIVEELPASTAQETTGLRVLTRMSVPVFQAPLRKTTAGEISRIELRGTRLAVDVQNRGTTSVMLKAARAIGKDAGGRVVWKGEATGWYLLAGGVRSFELDVPLDQAASISTVEVEADTDTGVWKKLVQVGGT
jgi:fimbrial chaperone protein